MFLQVSTILFTGVTQHLAPSPGQVVPPDRWNRDLGGKGGGLRLVGIDS